MNLDHLKAKTAKLLRKKMNFNFIFVIVIYFVNFVCAMPQISDSNAERKNTREDMLIGLFNRISGDDFVENQKKMLIENACPFLTDPSKCESDVELYWNLFSEGLFEEKSAIEFCEYPENDCQKERYYTIGIEDYLFQKIILKKIIVEIGIARLVWLISNM